MRIVFSFTDLHWLVNDIGNLAGQRQASEGNKK